MSWLLWWFQSNSSDTSGEFHPIEVPACAEGQSLPRYEVSHAWFLIVYVLSLFLVDFVPLCFPSLSLPAAEACTDEGRTAHDVLPAGRFAPASLFFLLQPT